MKTLNKKSILISSLFSLFLILACFNLNIFFSFHNIDKVEFHTKTSPTLTNPSTGSFVDTINGKTYQIEYISRDKIEDMKKEIELREQEKDFNILINGHGTGLAPPTENDLDNLIGKKLIKSIDSDFHQQLEHLDYQPPMATYDLSTDIYFPKVGNQGGQGSCAAWALTYYAYGYLEAKDYGWDASSGNPNYLMSPAWTYNKVGMSDSGSWMTENAQIIVDWGCATMTTMPYHDTDVYSWGEELAWREAPNHRAFEYYLMDFDEADPDSTIDAIKSFISSDTPVTFAIDAYEYSSGFSDGNYIISSAEYDSLSYNHAQCIVGFDDTKSDDGNFGAFKVVNSWGTSFGDNGYYWLTYECLKEIGNAIGDFCLHLCIITDLIDYQPDLIATWEFNPSPTRMQEIIRLGVGQYTTPLDSKTPWYEYDNKYVFPDFMAFDISQFLPYYSANNNVLFFLEIGSSISAGTISSFLIERYIDGVLNETTYESIDVPKSTPGYVINTFMEFDHEISVSLEVPKKPEIFETYMINATVTNTGFNDENDVYLLLYIDDVIVNSTTISTLFVGASETISYLWMPTQYKIYNFTAFAPPIVGESYITNNIETNLIMVSLLRNYIMTPGILYNWIDASNGTELILSDDDYAALTLPFDFTFYNETFSTVYLCSNGYLSFIDSTPTDYSNDPFPSTNPDHSYMIAPFWDDIDPPDGGHIYVQSFGTFWVAEWLDIYHRSGPVIGSFEVILNENGDIIFNYDYLDYTAGGYTCGLNLGEDINYYNSYQDLDDLIDDFAMSFSFKKLEHDLSVSLETPVHSEIGISYMINATVINNGLNDENDVHFLLYLDDTIINSTTISILCVGVSETISYLWTPTKYRTYNFTTYSLPVPEELEINNNLETRIITISSLRVAILNAAEKPSYFTGGLANNYVSIYNGLTAAGIDPIIITNDDILFGNRLFSANVLILIDNAPNDAASLIVKDWALNGGGVISFDSSICFLNWAGIIPPEAEGTNGKDIYWDYNSPNQGIVVNDIHPIMSGYNYGSSISGHGGDAQYFSDVIMHSSAGPYYEPLVKTDIGTNFDLVVALDAPYSGRVVQIWDYEHWNTVSNQLMILNAIQWVTPVILDHDLAISLDVPTSPKIGDTYVIDATVTNTGLNDENDVELFLYLDDVIVNSTTIPSLPVGVSETIHYMWTPTENRKYNFTAYAPPVPEESNINNNLESKILSVEFYGDISGPVAIFRNVLPWDENTTEQILNMYNIDYIVYPSSAMGIVDLSLFEKVIIASDQDQLFYDTLGSYISWFENYAAEGGILEIHACDDGWNSGHWSGSYLMPGGFDQEHTFTDYISINLITHPIVNKPHIITDSELDSWSSSAHGYFITYPGNSKQVLLDSNTVNPVCIELDYGEGTILITMQTLEWGYYKGYSNLLENMILFNPDAILVTVPNYTSQWETSISHDIIWDSNGIISNVKLELYKDGVFVMEIVASTPNDGEFSWSIPSGLEDSTQYQIKISDVSNPNTYDFSDYFEIYTLIVDSITIIKPNIASFWETGMSEEITWISTGTISNVKIDLYKDGVFVMEISASTPNNNEFSWTIPSGLEDSTQYQIRISDTSDPSIFDNSDIFEIYTPYIIVSSPDSSCQWETNDSYYIYWTSRGSIDNVKIDLYKDGVFVMEISASTPNDDEFSWTIPSGLEDSTLYQIRISDTSDPSIFDDSDIFEIYSSPEEPIILGYNVMILCVSTIAIFIFLIKNRMKSIFKTKK